MSVPFVDLQAMHKEIMPELLDAMTRIANKGNFILGDEVQLFEEDFAQYCGTKFAVGVDSGLSALKLALLAYDIGPGDEVIIPVNTFVATAAAVTFLGATPVFVDNPHGDYNINTELIEQAITENTRAIIPVHLYGIPADMDPIMEVTEKHNLLVLEDASQAHGAYYKGKRVGGIGHIAAFSLYPAKNLGAFGDAGVITTNDESVIQKLKAMRNCGQVAKYQHEFAPYNHRLDTMHAAVLRIKLRELDGWNEMRRQVVTWYDELLADTVYQIPQVSDDVIPVWHLYVVQTPQRDGLKQFLAEHQIGSSIHYPEALHQVAYYQHLDYKNGDFPVAEQQVNRILSLPMYPHMTQQHVEEVVRVMSLHSHEAMAQS